MVEEKQSHKIIVLPKNLIRPHTQAGVVGGRRF